MPATSVKQAKFMASLIAKKKGMSKKAKDAKTAEWFKGTSKKPDKVESKFPDKKKGKGKK